MFYKERTANLSNLHVLFWLNILDLDFLFGEFQEFMLDCQKKRLGFEQAKKGILGFGLFKKKSEKPMLY